MGAGLQGGDSGVKHGVVSCPLPKPPQEQRAVCVWRPYSDSTPFTAWERYAYECGVEVQEGLPKVHCGREAFLVFGFIPTSLCVGGGRDTRWDESPCLRDQSSREECRTLRPTSGSWHSLPALCLAAAKIREQAVTMSLYEQ